MEPFDSGRVVVDAAVTAQPETTGNLWACVPTAALTGPSAPTGLAPCAEVTAPLVPPIEPVSPAPFPVQLRFGKLNAEVLLGDVRPPSGP